MASKTLGIAWKVLFVADFGVLLYGLLAVSNPGIFSEGYLAYTGQDWSALVATSPKTAEYVLLLARVVGGLNVAVATAAIAMILAGFRRGEPWSWYGLLAVNTIGYGTPIAFDLTVGSIGVFERLEQVLIVVVYVSLAVCAREVLRKRPHAARVRESRT